ncbi:ABC transporter ATP-binding protein [Sinorhizobium fredii]|uniref:High-affinity branched-chain amino acid ABC transporter ATP-binding protein n=1 Tax=Rhizobium fredii TaxID=380 RepID=A0A2L0HBI4_RHIFR|nr:ABC transporter ATP-binding protein [Sinorhizobium fredii]AUX78794.1 high-affinity branched-chain amino acid ABC transporter ATP-binding protein [Sinorhizobium fredii]
MNATLTVAGATVEFSGLRALDNVSLSLAPCEIVGLIGPNGSGKTTLINAITGQVPLASGSITLGDRRISGLTPRQIALGGISRSFQIVRLFNNMTVIENVETAAIARGDSLRDARRKAERLIEELKLETKAHDIAAALNYGDKRRVEIARALAADPQFLLLDEPAAGMNDTETELLLHTLTILPAQRSLGIMIIDHDMALIMRLCHRLHVLASGKTIAAGSGDDIRRHPEVIRAYLGSAGAEAHAAG